MYLTEQKDTNEPTTGWQEEQDRDCSPRVHINEGCGQTAWARWQTERGEKKKKKTDRKREILYAPVICNYYQIWTSADSTIQTKWVKTQLGTTDPETEETQDIVFFSPGGHISSHLPFIVACQHIRTIRHRQLYNSKVLINLFTHEQT